MRADGTRPSTTATGDAVTRGACRSAYSICQGENSRTCGPKVLADFEESQQWHVRSDPLSRMLEIGCTNSGKRGGNGSRKQRRPISDCIRSVCILQFLFLHVRIRIFLLVPLSLAPFPSCENDVPGLRCVRSNKQAHLKRLETPRIM